MHASGRALAWLPLVFPLLHTAYGAGQLAGLVRPGFLYAQGAPLIVPLKRFEEHDREAAQAALDRAVAREALSAR